MRRSLTLLSCLLAFSATRPSLASDLADEAELKFSLGAEAYQRADYRRALEEFLASNRLVPNRNVLFNIARCYEQLKQHPEAYRYYLLAVEAETDPAIRAQLEQALARIRQRVAVLDIESDPPGATLYVDRRDLGPRGSAPRALGLAPGSYRILAELPGHDPTELSVPLTAAGEVRRVKLKLSPILGQLSIGESASGARVRLDGATGPVACVAPCQLSLAPGRRTLYLDRLGYLPAEVSVEVLARRRVLLSPTLAAYTGSLVVATDEPGALLEVDGISRGFTPVVLTLPVGMHRVRLSLSGYRTVEREVAVHRDRERRVELALAETEEVSAASRNIEAVDDAPSSVTIIPLRELKAMRYATVAEALRGVAGVYGWNDHSYQTVGFRGLGRLGSYGNRVLVLVDGHPLNDNWIGSSYVGYDARVSLEDLERIEIVRGPGSVLYGTNAFSGVINLVTLRARKTGSEVSLSTADSSVGRARVRANARLGQDSELWTSASVAHGAGHDFYFPEFAEGPGQGNSRGADGFDAGTLEGRLLSGSFSASWYYEAHRKRIPTGEYETLLGDPRAVQTDTRSSLELKVEPRWGGSVASLTRLHANQYGFTGGYPHAPADGGLETDTFRGAWAGLEQRLEVSPNESLKLTLGGEGQLHFQNEQRARDEAGTYLDESRPYQVGAAYALLDVRAGDSLRVSAGARLDAYSTFGESLNPRAAVVVKPYASGNSKLMLGRAFRAPSAYELYYNDGGLTQVSNPSLAPENVYSAELEHTHRFSATVSARGAVFANYLRNLLLAEGEGHEASPLQYTNSRAPIGTLGFELGLRRDWRRGYMLAASYSFQHSRFLDGDRASALFNFDASPDFRNVANAPEHIVSVKGAVPLLSRSLTLASRITAESGRYDRNERVTDAQQTSTSPFALWDLVLSGAEPRSGLTWAAGVYNAFDWRYSLPLSNEFRQASLIQAGRSFLLSTELSF